jgi:hypothetical protein
MIILCSLFLFRFDSPAEHCSLENFSGSWCVNVADFKTLEKKAKLFDDARQILTENLYFG